MEPDLDQALGVDRALAFYRHLGPSLVRQPVDFAQIPELLRLARQHLAPGDLLAGMGVASRRTLQECLIVPHGRAIFINELVGGSKLHLHATLTTDTGKHVRRLANLEVRHKDLMESQAACNAELDRCIRTLQDQMVST